MPTTSDIDELHADHKRQAERAKTQAKMQYPGQVLAVPGRAGPTLSVEQSRPYRLRPCPYS